MNAENLAAHLLVLVPAGAAGGPPYSLEEAARLTAVHPDLLRYYCIIGLLGETRRDAAVEPSFDDNGLYAVRRIEHLRRHHGVDRRTLPLVCALLRECEQLRAELRFLRTR